MLVFSYSYSLHRHRLIGVVLLCLLLWLSPTAYLHAAEPLEIVVSGIDGDALKNVQSTLVLPAGLTEEETVDRLWLDRFAQQAGDTVRKALEPFGYYNAQTVVKVEANGERYRLLVFVTPGEPVRLTEVTVALTGPGSGEKSLQNRITRFPLKKGDVLLHQRYEDAKTLLKSRAVERGYLDAEFTRHEIRIPKAATTATIELALDTGEKYFFGPTRIQGANDYPDSFLRRHLTYPTGAYFSYPALGETQRTFTNSERFKEVTITAEKTEAVANQVPVSIRLTPGPPKSLRPGIGYGTDTGARFTLRYRDLNLFHQGHEFYSQLYLAERLQGLVTGYIIPSPSDVRSSTMLQLNLQQEDTTAYSSKIAALELAQNRGLGPGKLGTAYVKAQYEEYTVGTVTSNARLLLPGVRFTDNRYDNLLRPRQGFHYSVDLRGTHQLLGSDTALVQILAEGSHLLPLPWRLSLHTRVKGATTLLSDTFKDIPPSLRFFAGGDQSVRGYSYKSLGPRDASGAVTGGRQLLFASIELERALYKNWTVSMFYDTGNTFNSFSTVALAQGAGVGLHYITPVGALNLSLARPLGIDNPKFHIHFTVGFEL
jgi:translocation and assembly module TamA